jgi:hypothetical protein
MKRTVLKIQLIILLFVTTISHLSGQQKDKIYLKNLKVLEGKVIQVTPQSIEIDPDGDIPFLIIPRDSVSVLIYSNNQVINFENSGQQGDDREKLKTFTYEFTNTLYIENKYLGGWASHQLNPYETEIIDKENNKRLNLYLRGYVHARNNDDGEIKSAVDFGYILMEIDLVYDNEKYTDRIEIDEGRTWTEGTGKYPGIYIFELGDYAVNMTFDFEYIHSRSMWKGYRSYYAFNINSLLKVMN